MNSSNFLFEKENSNKRYINENENNRGTISHLSKIIFEMINKIMLANDFEKRLQSKLEICQNELFKKSNLSIQSTSKIYYSSLFNFRNSFLKLKKNKFTYY